MRFEGENVLVTGASRGIGAAIADAFGEAGAFVTGTATTEAGADAIRRRFADTGRAGQGLVVDVASGDSVTALFAVLGEQSRLPGVVVNNAGITRDGLLARMSEQDWERVISTDLTSVFRICKAAARHLMKARRGCIVNITSVVGATGNAGQTNYAAAKAGIIGLTRSLARELASRSVTVNAIAPGFIDTDMTRALDDQQRERLLGQIPLGRLGSGADVAAAALFLASPGGAYVTGQVLHVNGGMFMG